MTDIEMLRTARAAVLGLDTTTGEPQLIVQAAVYYVDGGLVTSGALSYWSRPDVPAMRCRPDAGRACTRPRPGPRRPTGWSS